MRRNDGWLIQMMVEFFEGLRGIIPLTSLNWPANEQLGQVVADAMEASSGSQRAAAVGQKGTRLIPKRNQFRYLSTTEKHEKQLFF